MLKNILEKVSLGLRTIDGIRKEDLVGINWIRENLQKPEALGRIKMINLRKFEGFQGQEGETPLDINKTQIGGRFLDLLIKGL